MHSGTFMNPGRGMKPKGFTPIDIINYAKRNPTANTVVQLWQSGKINWEDAMTQLSGMLLEENRLLQEHLLVSMQKELPDITLKQFDDFMRSVEQPKPTCKHELLSLNIHTGKLVCTRCKAEVEEPANDSTSPPSWMMNL